MSKTLLFAPCFLDEGERLQRNIKWLDYIEQLKTLKHDKLLLVDNASSEQYMSKLIEKCEKSTNSITIWRCETRLNRISEHAYGYWYRAFRLAIEYAIMGGYDKIVHIDTDVYLLNNRIIDYVNNLDKGWTCFWCDIHQYPETTFQVICKDQFNKAQAYFTDGFLQFYPYDLAEKTIPFTHIEKGFKGDRYGEVLKPQDPSMEWYGQAPVATILRFNG